MMIVESDEPVSGRVNSSAAASAPVLPAPCLRRTMCSDMTIASSMINPTAAAMPPSVITFRLSPSA